MKFSGLLPAFGSIWNALASVKLPSARSLKCSRLNNYVQYHLSGVCIFKLIRVCLFSGVAFWDSAICSRILFLYKPVNISEHDAGRISLRYLFHCNGDPLIRDRGVCCYEPRSYATLATRLLSYFY